MLWPACHRWLWAHPDANLDMFRHFAYTTAKAYRPAYPDFEIEKKVRYWWGKRESGELHKPKASQDRMTFEERQAWRGQLSGQARRAYAMDRDERIIRLHEDGLSQRMIAKHPDIGCSLGSVQHVLRRLAG